MTIGPVSAKDITLLSDDDLYLFNKGEHFRLYDRLGAHPGVFNGEYGTYFAVWAPNARQVSVMGVFNNWDKASHPLRARARSGIWEGFIPGLDKGAMYKFHVVSNYGDYRADKADPFALHTELPPGTSSVVWDLKYGWGDGQWLEKRGGRAGLSAPLSTYEVHLGSWRRVPEENHRWLTYRELAARLVPYVKQMGFSHVEFLPVMEHPFFGSWGYQTTGYFAPTARYGSPQELMYLIDQLHQNDIGVILDWVPSHFPTDEHGLGYFDGTHLYEHADPRRGFHPDWNSFIFNYGRDEVRSFLISSALFWLDRYHADALRVDAVASMLYHDYSRKEGEWLANKYGGRHNLEAIDLLRRFNEEVYRGFPGAQTIAEESTAWPMVSRPAYAGGLGFGYKWDMGWMHDMLDYIATDPLYRRYHHHDLTFRMLYAFTENFILPLSHDEVVHGKGSLLGKMPGDFWQKFANLRLLFGYMYAQPGKKLLFMGGEFAQWSEWHHDESLEWHLLQYEPHHKLQKWLEDLNRTYRDEKPLHELDCEPAGFQWVNIEDGEQSVISFARKGKTTGDIILAVFNFTPVPRENYVMGAPRGGQWQLLLNSDREAYGGSNFPVPPALEAAPQPAHGFPDSLTMTLPPLAALLYKSQAA